MTLLKSFNSHDFHINLSYEDRCNFGLYLLDRAKKASSPEMRSAFQAVADFFLLTYGMGYNAERHARWRPISSFPDDTRCLLAVHGDLGEVRFAWRRDSEYIDYEAPNGSVGCLKNPRDDEGHLWCPIPEEIEGGRW